VDRLQGFFQAVDASGNGSISRAELIRALRKDPELARLVNLPERIRQEDGTREHFEQVWRVWWARV
jgi:hypothetical protein